MKEQNKNVLNIVTGSAGFIGSNIIKDIFSDEGRFVIGLDRKEFMHSEFKDMAPDLEVVNSNYTYHHYEQSVGDITLMWYPIDLAETHSGVYELNEVINSMIENTKTKFNEICIWHCASPIGVEAHNNSNLFNDGLVINETILNLANMLHHEFAVTLNFMSSSEIYGDIEIKDKKFSTQGFLYKDLVSHMDPTFFSGNRASYVRQKIDAELMFLSVDNGIEVNIFRLFNIYGMYQNPKNGVIPKLIDIVANERNFIYVDAESTRTYTDVNFAVKKMREIARIPNCSEVFNICENTVLSGGRLLGIILDESNMFIKSESISSIEFINNNPELALSLIKRNIRIDHRTTEYTYQSGKKLYTITVEVKNEIKTRSINKKKNTKIKKFSSVIAGLFETARNKVGQDGK